ncbi:DUF1349 domain-containing protein [Haploplasma axanthum]|uniref:Uncharacterized conserved protein n=1 Tax=Haploplasma axanthum TaxID=29552 RepID=A0A449BDB7_HAPAX|nr:DUF1349 domain-containing protein [Haploplasma axanthum]VEU80436.1 Uncharacterized conserved protein [Haploplasma axanthum]
MFKFDFDDIKWLNKPLEIEKINDNSIRIKTTPGTDLWQKTYYGFMRDNAHILYVSTSEKFFTFNVKVEFNSSELFDQTGVVIYQDSNNWFKSGIEYHNNAEAWLGSVVTNNGYSDWATTNIGAFIKSMWYRLSRRENDFLLENSYDGINYQQMRIFHLFKADDAINIGLIACSPTNGSFDATFSNIKVTNCIWKLENE